MCDAEVREDTDRWQRAAGIGEDLPVLRSMYVLLTASQMCDVEVVCIRTPWRLLRVVICIVSW